jgi:hypothetical protein
MEVHRSARYGLVVAALVIVLAPACRNDDAIPQVTRPDMYSSDAFRIRVVDAATGKPIEGAAVVVIWRLVDSVFHFWSGTFRYVELRTDRDGYFLVNRWGPRWVDRSWYLDSRDPEIWILKRGYLLGYFDNSGALDPLVFSGASTPERISKPSPRMTDTPLGFARGAAGSSVWAGRTVTLRPISTPKEGVLSLAAAAPIDPYDQGDLILGAFKEEWFAARAELGPEWAISPPKRGFQEEQPRFH